MKVILKENVKAKKRIGTILIIAIVFFLGLGAISYAQQTNLKDRIWLKKYVNLADYVEGKPEIKVISNEKAVSYLNLDYQQTVTNKINQLVKKNSYTVEEPLMVLNPYGTNHSSINVYFDSREDAYLEYTISSQSGKYSDFVRVAANGEKDNLTQKHTYQLMGLIPEEENKIKLTLYNVGGEVIGESSVTVKMPKLASNIATQIEMEEGSSKTELTDGLYALFGHSKSFQANIYLYDNEGVIRGELPVKDYRSDRILMIDNCLVYSYDENKIAKVNRLGQMVDKYIFSGYELHHDFTYDQINNKIIMLATELEQETVEDIILQLDLKTGITTELIDFKTIMPESYEAAVKPAEKETLDWIHFNAIQVIDGKELILSARESSSVVKVSDIYKNPTLTYLLADESMWKGTAYETYAYEKIGEFSAHGGQHTTAYVKDESLEVGQYYLYMYNNNLAFSGTKPDFDWSAYKGAGTHKNPTDSYYYRYLVDENAKTFELVKSFQVPYSSYVSSAQDIKENHVICSGLAYNFGEYDSTGTLIRQFNFIDKKNTYRVFKYDFDNFYFYYK